MLIDPHVNPHHLSPDELIDLMIDASLDGAVITCTHSALDAEPYVNALLDEDFVAYVGVELLTTFGALVFIPKVVNHDFLKANWSPKGSAAIQREQRDLDGELIESQVLWDLDPLLLQLKSFEGILIVVHPFSRLSATFWGDRAYTLTDACAVEVRTGRGLPVRDFLSDEIAETKGWSRLGSCSGDLAYLGASVTAVLESADHQESLCDALRQGICWPIEFERPELPRPRYQGVVEDEGPRRISLAEKESREALDEVNRRRPQKGGAQKGGAPIDQIFGRGPKKNPLKKSSHRQRTNR